MNFHILKGASSLNFLNKLERKFGRFSIENLMLYIVIGTGIVFGFYFLFPDIPLIQYLTFDRDAIFRGQVWRLISFIFIPESSSPISMIFWLLLYYMIGSNLENYWGSFRFNVFYFSGVLFAIIAGLITGYATVHYLNLTLFLAMAVLSPNTQLLLFYIIPVKMKWLAWVDAALLIYSFIPVPAIITAIQAKLSFGNAMKYLWLFNDVRVLILLSVLNFLLFFGGDFIRKIRDRFKYRNVRRNFKKNIKMTHHDGE